MQPLVTDFTQGNYRYRQLTRTGDVALFAQEHLHAPVTRYEVVVITVAPATTWPNGHTTPEREAYPGASSWGHKAWTFLTQSEAEVWMQELYAQRGAGADDLACPRCEAIEQAVDARMAHALAAIKRETQAQTR